MFKNLIPWKNQHGRLAVHHDEPTRANEQQRYSLTTMRDEFDALMHRFFDDPWMQDRLMNEFPEKWDLGWQDEGNEYVFHAELPGFDSEDFEVKVSGNMLTVCAEHNEEKKHGKNGSGYRYGSFTRTFTLPHGVDEDKIGARYHSGVLEVHLPKTAEAQGKRIEVKSS